MGYLQFTLVSALMIVIVIALMMSSRDKEKSNSRVSQKPKNPGKMPQPSIAVPAVGRENLKGGSYTPSYQSNPDLAKHVERFLSGANIRSDHSIAEKQNDVDVGVIDEFLGGDNGLERSASGKDEREGVKTREMVQLELDIKDTKDWPAAANK